MEASPRHNDGVPTLVATRLLAAQPDGVLCKLAARGNIGAYDALYERYRTPLVAFVFHLLGRGGSAEDAEDIAQDAFTRAFAGIREKRVDGSFKAWLYTIARNRSYDQMRARRENVVSLDAESVAPPSAPDREQPAERAEQRAELAWLLAAMAQLPERQREALLLKEMGGLSHDRIADELGTTVSATKKLISRGRDGIDQAAATGGFGCPRRLGRDLALAAPVLPLSVSLASLGVSAGAGTAAGVAAAGAGGVAAGKVAATALTVLAVGGGAVAVEHREAAPDAAPAAQAVGIPAGVSSGDPRDRLIAGPIRTQSGDRQGGEGRGDEPLGEDRRGRGEGGDQFGDDGGRGRGRGGDDFAGRDGSGRTGGGDSRGSGRSRGGSGEDGREAEAEPPHPSESGESGDDSGGESGGHGGSENSGPSDPDSDGGGSGSDPAGD